MIYILNQERPLMVDLLIIAIHGTGNADDDYYKTFYQNLDRAFARAGIDEESYVFGGIHYSKVFNKEANKISEMTQDLKWKNLRRFISHTLGDALAYQAGVDTETRIDFYNKVHSKIDDDLQELVRKHNISDDTPILFIAHSLGAYVISNYIWDKQRSTSSNNSLLDMETFCSLITIGCNIPILTLGFDYDTLYPITIPGSSLREYGANETFNWVNVYDKHDPLAIPMKDLYSHENELQRQTIQYLKDIEMNVGNLLVRYTPVSHTKYWNHGSFIDLVTDKVVDILNTLK